MVRNISCLLILLATAAGGAIASPSMAVAQRASVTVHVGPAAAVRGVPQGTANSLQADSVQANAVEQMLREEITRVRALRVGPRERARYIVRGSILKLERRRVDGQLEVSCELALLVTDAHGETIRMMLSSRGAARGSVGETLERAAVRAAVRGVVRPLADAAQQRRRASA